MPLGIPHSEFLSWSEEDQDKALAFMREKATICRDCGTRLDDWDPDKGGHRHAFVGDVQRCPGCELLEQEQENVRRDMTSMRGIKVRLKPNPERV